MCQPGRTQPGMQGVHTPTAATRNHVPMSGLETGSPTLPQPRCGEVAVPPHNRSNPRKQSRAPQLECDAAWVVPTQRTSSNKVAASVQPTLVFWHSAPHNSIRASERQADSGWASRCAFGSWGEIPLTGRLLLRLAENPKSSFS
jgi:hypothetical protein